MTQRYTAKVKGPLIDYVA